MPCPHRTDAFCPICQGASGLALLGLLTTGLGCGVGTSLYGGPMTMDLDQDGHYDDVDCDDGDAAIHPGAVDEAGDGIDQDCDGVDGKASP